MKVVTSKIMYGVISLAVIAIIYTVLNLGLVGIQNWWHADDNAKFEQLKAELESLKSDIETQENELRSENDPDAYNDLYETYEKNVDTYNEKVKEANELAKKVGSTWVIVPVPGKH